MANKSFVVQYIIKAREKFSQSANKVSRSADNMRNRISRANKSFKKFSATARKTGAILSAAVTAPILLMANSLKNAARDAEETRSKFRSVFKDISKESELAADNLAKNFGLAGSTSRDLLADTGDLLSGFGFTGKAALDMSVQVNKLAVDIASFKNAQGGAKAVSDALTKSLLGERESLKTYGIAILEADVKTRILKLAQEGQKFETLRQAKAIATLSLIMDQSKNSIGDFLRTKKELANQERITSERLKEAREVIGDLLVPVFLKLTKIVRSVADAFIALSPQTKKIILIIAGVIAVLGPLLLLFGSIVLVLPAIGVAFTAMGAVALAIFSPIGLAVVAIAAAAFLVISNWKEVRLFFESFGDKVISIFDFIGERIDNIKKGLQEFIKIIPSIPSFSDIKAKFSGISLPSFGDVKNSFFGDDKKTTSQLNKSKVDVGVTVGLDSGLKQTSQATINRSERRTDTGSQLAFAQ